MSNEIISHNSRDSTAIEGWEKPILKKAQNENQEQSSQKKRKKGRPKKGEEKITPEPTRIEKQLNMTLAEMLKDLPAKCDVGAKKDQQGK